MAGEKFMEIMKSLVNEMKHYRLMNNMTQREFAVAINVPYSSVVKWETGRIMPDIEALIKTAKIFNVTEMDLLYPNENIEENSQDISIKQKRRTSQKTVEEIKRRRLFIGMTQGELAQKIDVSRQSIYYWESGLRRPKKELLPKIAEALGCTEADLLSPSADAGQPDCNKIAETRESEKVMT